MGRPTKEEQEAKAKVEAPKPVEVKKDAPKAPYWKTRGK